MPVELRHLRYFVAVAEELHFGRAAERLHISQPPLSQAIRSLEAELGCSLFTRTSRQVRLTPAGEALLDRARATLAMADAAINAAREAGNGLTGRLRIGMTPMARHGVGPEILNAFRRMHRHVEILKREELTGPLVAAVRGGDLDAALVYSAARSDDVDFEPVRDQPLVAIVADDHRLADRGTVALTELAGECFLLPSATLAPGFRPAFERLCLAAGFSPQVSDETIEFDEDLLLVRSGRGIVVTSQDFVADGAPGVRVLSLDPPESLPIELVTSRGEPSPHVERFVAIVRELRETNGWLNPRSRAAV